MMSGSIKAEDKEKFPLYVVIRELEV